jgi:hypothetical protein
VVRRDNDDIRQPGTIMKNLILTLDNSGQPHTWSTWQEAITLKCKGLVAWEFGSEEFLFHGGTSRASGQRSLVEVASIIALKVKFNNRERVPPFNNRDLFRRDLGLCAYCGHGFGENNLTKDHVIPASRGGATGWMNCVTACTKCNGRKDDRTPEEANMLLKYVPYVPDRAEGLILKNRNILADQMDFLKNFLPQHSRVWQTLEQ